MDFNCLAYKSLILVLLLSQMNVVAKRIKSFPQDGVQSSDNVKPEIIPEDQNTASDIAIGSLENKTADSGSAFLSKLGILLGVAAVITLVSVGIKPPSQGTSLGIQFLLDGSSSSTLAAPTGAFSFRAFGYRVLLPEYAPGWIYFWLLMAAGCGLFISEEALNIWVGISLARLLSLDGTWQSLVDSFSRNAPYMISTVVWVYWGVCISDMIPFYLGKIFKQSGASNDIWSKLAIGFLLRERPVFALATVATVVGIWTVFPYAVAALTAAFLYLRRRYSS
ncbi:UNVERIFIED_CONTAM: hypothetical protein Sradi_0323400 [Sesamum radiatum]|uniref:Uncharacterized protein n=1 Tax=Sesamum radiatum TaxID=300843 RepID=A0AAW2W7P4_SESRA